LHRFGAAVALRSKEGQRRARIKPAIVKGPPDNGAAKARAIWLGQPPHILDRS
jgi:hypothetical protein